MKEGLPMIILTRVVIICLSALVGFCALLVYLKELNSWAALVGMTSLLCIYASISNFPNSEEGRSRYELSCAFIAGGIIYSFSDVRLGILSAIAAIVVSIPFMEPVQN